MAPEMTSLSSHLIITPILLPLLASAVLLLFSESQLRIKRTIALLTSLLLVGNAAALVYLTQNADAAGPMVYLLGDWPAPFGIVLVADRLSAMLLVLTSILGCTSLIYAMAKWDRVGPRFHVLFLFMLMGVNGAFLTGDIFNLFVFFELMLTASYGLLLHGSGAARAKAGLHYIAINVATSLLFLLGVALLYSVTGTLNMADLAMRIPETQPQDVVLQEVGAALLGIAFLVKAGMWPLSFWLPTAYAAATPPVSALFAILSKVGIYVIVRLSLLLFGDLAGGSANFADNWLLVGGIVTIVYGTIGVLSCRTLPRLAGHYLLISSGTLLAAIGTGSSTVLAAALLYLVSSTLAVSAFYLIIEPIERGETDAEEDASGDPIFDDEYTGKYEEDEDEVGVIIPANIAILGGAFAFCALLLSGMPPLSGFIAKFAIIDGIFRAGSSVDVFTWVYVGVIITSGMAVLMALSRAGIDLIWTPDDSSAFKLRLEEVVPVGILIALCTALMLQSGAAMKYMEDITHSLHAPHAYIEAVLSKPGRTTA